MCRSVSYQQRKLSSARNGRFGLCLLEVSNSEGFSVALQHATQRNAYREASSSLSEACRRQLSRLGSETLLPRIFSRSERVYLALPGTQSL